MFRVRWDDRVSSEEKFSKLKRFILKHRVFLAIAVPMITVVAYSISVVFKGAVSIIWLYLMPVILFVWFIFISIYLRGTLGIGYKLLFWSWRKKLSSRDPEVHIKENLEFVTELFPKLPRIAQVLYKEMTFEQGKKQFFGYIKLLNNLEMEKQFNWTKVNISPTYKIFNDPYLVAYCSEKFDENFGNSLPVRFWWLIDYGIVYFELQIERTRKDV